MRPREYVLMPYGLTVRLVDGEDGYVVASCLELPGCHSQGKTLSEAVANIEDAVLGYLAILEDEGAEAMLPVDATATVVITPTPDITAPLVECTWEAA